MGDSRARCRFLVIGFTLAAVSTQTTMTVAVTGATGFVGRHTVAALLARGHHVRALARHREKARKLLPTGAAHQGAGSLEVVFGDIFDRDVVRTLTSGCRAMIHTIGIRRELPPDVTFRRHHVLATQIALDAARASGVNRFIHLSALGVRPEGNNEYCKSKWESEQLVRSSELDWTIFRPSLIHGPDGEFMRLIKDWALGRSAPRLFIPYFTRPVITKSFPPKPPKFVSAHLAPVSVSDVASMLAQSVTNQRTVGEVYPLAGPDTLDWPTLLAGVRDALPLVDSPKRICGIPAPLAWAMAMKAKILGFGSLLPYGPSEPLLAIEDSLANCTKARAHLGFEPAPFMPTMKAYAAQI